MQKTKNEGRSAKFDPSPLFNNCACKYPETHLCAFASRKDLTLAVGLESSKFDNVRVIACGGEFFFLGGSLSALLRFLLCALATSRFSVALFACAPCPSLMHCVLHPL